jgi:hypothetical protein
VRSLNTQEQAVLSSVKPIIGISGGSKKIKSKDLIGMKKNLKGGQSAAPATTDPRSRTYSANIQNGPLVDAFRKCESSHYISPGDSTAVFGDQQVRNTSAVSPSSRLRKCVGQQIINKLGLPATVIPDILSASAALTALGFNPTQDGLCTVEDSATGRVVCPSPAARTAKITPSRAIPTLSYLGGSSKRKSRSPPPSIKNRSPNRKMARKSSRRATRRASSRKGSRKGSRKTRRNRK